jgi:hypothetical protein
MTALGRRVHTIEANRVNRPMSKADEEMIRARLLAKVHLLGAGRDLPAACKYRHEQFRNPALAASRERLIAKLELMVAANEDDREPGVEFIPLPADELDRLEDFLVETQRHVSP